MICIKQQFLKNFCGEYATVKIELLLSKLPNLLSGKTNKHTISKRLTGTCRRCNDL